MYNPLNETQREKFESFLEDEGYFIVHQCNTATFYESPDGTIVHEDYLIELIEFIEEDKKEKKWKSSQ